MMDLAIRTDRFLGGRPPYGYKLVDAGPHPNPGRAAAGQRAHRLEPDESTSVVVRRILELYVSGFGLRAIAQLLTDGGYSRRARTTRAGIRTATHGGGRSQR